MIRHLLLLFLFAQLPAAHAFQFADADSKVQAGSPKCIFYWGRHQCELTEGNGYKNRLSVTAPSFRQMLLQMPSFWNGTTLVRDFSFKLDGMQVSTVNYAAQLGKLDVTLGPKIAQGSLIEITDLPLADGLSGTVGILIDNTEDTGTEQFPRSNWTANKPMLNQNFLERVVWGREDLLEISNRDFFTVAEFWQTVRFEPLIEWYPNVTTQALRAIVSFQSPEKGTFSLSALLSEEGSYRALLENLNNYKYLAKPGTTVSLSIETVEQYEQLYKKPMRLVEENARQLSLRRDRNTHTLEIEWGSFNTMLDGYYLTTVPDIDNKDIPVDDPRSIYMTVTNVDSIQADLYTLKPVCHIDGEEVSGLSFRIKVGSNYYTPSEGNQFSPKAAAEIARNAKLRLEIQLDSFTLAGYTLPDLRYVLHYATIKNTDMVRNTFESLMAASTHGALINLSTPIVDQEAVEVTFNIPKDALVKVSLFDPSGFMVQIMADKYTAGEHKVRLPYGLARMSGKHFVFLNTPFGVVKQEVELK